MYITKDVEKQNLLLWALGTDCRVGEDTESKSASPGANEDFEPSGWLKFAAIKSLGQSAAGIEIELRN